MGRRSDDPHEIWQEGPQACLGPEDVERHTQGGAQPPGGLDKNLEPIGGPELEDGAFAGRDRPQPPP